MPAKTREQVQAERRAEIDAIQQMEANWAAWRAEQQKAQEEFAQRVQQRRDAIDAYVRTAWGKREDGPMTAQAMAAARAAIEQEAYAVVKSEGRVPTLDELFTADTQRRIAEEAEAERARLAAISDHDYWLAMQPLKKREEIKTQERMTGLTFPIPVADLEAVRAARKETQ